MKLISKAEIKQTTIELIQEKGYQNVTIMDICHACQITRPTFYKYVGSKEELILDFYDSTIQKIIGDPMKLALADSHYEQLVWLFYELIADTKRFGVDLFSQMLIANLNEDRHSFDLRNSLTDLSITIIQKAQEQGEIQNQCDANILYEAIAHCFMGYETTWCIKNGTCAWEKPFFLSLNAILNVREDLKDIYLKFITE